MNKTPDEENKKDSSTQHEKVNLETDQKNKNAIQAPLGDLQSAPKTPKADDGDINLREDDGHITWRGDDVHIT